MNHRPENIATNSLDSLLGFNGERIDSVLGSYHLGNGYRLYNLGLHRFSSPDSMSPFGKGGINSYAYCQGDPINQTDPTGRFGVFKFMESVGVIALGGGTDDPKLEVNGGRRLEKEEHIGTRSARRDAEYTVRPRSKTTFDIDEYESMITRKEEQDDQKLRYSLLKNSDDPFEPPFHPRFSRAKFIQNPGLEVNYLNHSWALTKVPRDRLSSLATKNNWSVELVNENLMNGDLRRFNVVRLNANVPPEVRNANINSNPEEYIDNAIFNWINNFFAQVANTQRREQERILRNADRRYKG